MSTVATPGTPQPRRRTRAENRDFRRDSLITAAISVVARHDITGATVERICEHAGVSRGLIGHYFDSKEQLLVVALEFQFNRAVRIKYAIAQDTALTPVARLNAMAAASFEPPIYTVDEMSSWQAFTNASRSLPAFRPPIRYAGRALHDLFEPQFRAAAAERRLDINGSRAAFGLVTLLDGLWNSLATGKDNADPEEAIATCQLFIEGCLKPV